MRMTARRADPLRGLRVLITRPAHQVDTLRDALEARGAVTRCVPLLRIAPVAVPAEAWRAVPEDTWVVFTSANGVAFGWDAAPERFRAALRAHARVACVGPATAAAARARGIPVRDIAAAHQAESLATLLESARAERVLWIRGAEARDVLPRRLSALGARLDQVVCYRSEPATLGDAERDAIAGARVITVTSPSAARALAHAAAAPPGALLACIGPVTAHAAQEAGLVAHAVADEFTADGLVSAVERLAARDSLRQ
jgi:uroporphyrinogen-III synthase